MTMYEYIDEVKVRGSRYDIQLELDDLTIEMLVNRARRDVQMATLPLFRERYGRIATLSAAPSLVSSYTSGTVAWYSIALPADMIEETVVYLTSNTKQWEARKLSKPEMDNIARNSWNAPTANAPAYVVEKDPGNSVATLFISKGSGVVAANETELWYVAALPYLQAYPDTGSPDVERKMSYQWEELVVLCALAKTYEMSQYQGAKELLMSDIQTVVTLLEENYKTRVDRPKLLLPSRESLVPNVPILDVPVQGGKNE